MGQQNEIEDPEIILNKLNSYEENLIKENIFSEDSFTIVKNVAKEYIQYKSILDKHQKKKTGKKIENKNDENYDKNKIDEINHKFDRLNKWIKMAKTPYYNNFQLFLNKIRGDEKKNKNKNLYKDKSTDNIFGKGVRRKNIKLDNNISNQEPMTDRNLKSKDQEMIPIKRPRHKKTTSFDKINENAIKEEKEKDTNKDKDKESIENIKLYSDKNIEEKIISFYAKNQSKFKERVIKGPPESFRWLSWCIINNVPLERDINIYHNYVVKDLEKENKDSIIRDIQRTFSDTTISKDELRKNETNLYNILKAFWNLDNELGYCQGMNLLVGFMLLISENNELDSFYLLIANLSSTFNKKKEYYYSIRGLFSEEFPLLAFLNFIFDILLEENIPDIKNHLDEMGITYDLWVGQWFQTLFTIVLPINWCKRVWDCIYSENIYFLVKFGIVFTKLIKNDILEKSEEIEVIDFFKELQKFSMCQENKFLEQKCDINNLIIKANKIKLDPEEYVKLYKKKNEDYKNFKSKMKKNSNITYPLEMGNCEINEKKMKTRTTVLFEKDEIETISKESLMLGEIKEKYNEEEKDKEESDSENENNNIIINDNKNENKNNKNKNVYYDHKNKNYVVKINKHYHQIKNNNKEKEESEEENEGDIFKEKNQNEIKIKPILKRQHQINKYEYNRELKPKNNILEIFDNKDNIDINQENEINNIKEEKDEDKDKNINNIDINDNGNDINPIQRAAYYKKKKVNSKSFKQKTNPINQINQINYENFSNNKNKDNNDINNNFNINNYENTNDQINMRKNIRNMHNRFNMHNNYNFINTKDINFNNNNNYRNNTIDINNEYINFYGDNNNNYNNKYYDVNLADDNANLDRYYSNYSNINKGKNIYGPNNIYNNKGAI